MQESETENLAVSDICPICNGSEWIFFVDVNGYEMAKPCECREKAIMERKLRFANLPEAFKNITLKRFDITKYKSKESKKIITFACEVIRFYLDNFEQMKERGRGLYIYSKTKGSGKTMMVAGIANKLLENHQVKFCVSVIILDEIKKTWDKESDYQSESKLLHDLSNTDILIIDDFGTEKVSGWVNDKFYHIINERYINKKVTIFTSNDSLSELKYDERISNRVKERSYEIAFPEESIREYIAADNNSAMIDNLREGIKSVQLATLY